MEIVGADGCKAGWVLARRTGLDVVPRLTRDDDRLIGIDMPIGLADNGRRACDFKARSFLGRRASTVFPAPPRAAIIATDYETANRLTREASGGGLSVQCFNLFVKIREVDSIVDETTDATTVEVHPECAFATMCGGDPLPGKRTAEGIRLRRELVEAEFGPLAATPSGARLDDVLDAYAVLWSTERFARGAHREFGDGSRDRRGLPMRIVC